MQTSVIKKPASYVHHVAALHYLLLPLNAPPNADKTSLAPTPAVPEASFAARSRLSNFSAVELKSWSATLSAARWYCEILWIPSAKRSIRGSRVSTIVLMREESVGCEIEGASCVSFCEDLVGIEVVAFGVEINEVCNVVCNVVNIAAWDGSSSSVSIWAASED